MVGVRLKGQGRRYGKPLRQSNKVITEEIAPSDRGQRKHEPHPSGGIKLGCTSLGQQLTLGQLKPSFLAIDYRKKHICRLPIPYSEAMKY